MTLHCFLFTPLIVPTFPACSEDPRGSNAWASAPGLCFAQLCCAPTVLPHVSPGHPSGALNSAKVPRLQSLSSGHLSIFYSAFPNLSPSHFLEILSCVLCQLVAISIPIVSLDPSLLLWSMVSWLPEILVSLPLYVPPSISLSIHQGGD